MTIKSTSILLVGSLAAAVVHAETPVFEPISAKTGHFVEQFTEDWEERWSPSAATKVDRNQEVFSYVGKWAVEEPSVFPGIKGDKGLVAKSKAAHHAVSSLFETPYDAEKEGGLVLQYEVKLQNGLECGGAYTKLLLDSAQGIQAQELSDKTPYTIMFGPDRCGSTNKVHFIFRHKNPLTGEYEEKHLKSPPTPKHDKVSTLYTLIVRKDNTYEIKIDGQSKKSGSLLTDFDPPVNPEKQIDDPNDTKPADWVDEAKITDPDATKPDDWDEDAPFEIEDLDAVKPAGWLDDEPALIPDPDAEKPEEWSDEDDGDWIPPSVPNPKVADAPGSGPWIRPKKPNPDYKGKWFAAKIDNPAYKGVWAPRKIENPDFFEDDVPYAFSPIAGVAFEWWTMQENIMVDNIYLGNSEKAAADFAAATFDVKKPIEEAAEKASKPVTSDDDDSAIASLRDFSIPSFLADPVNYARSQVTGFVQSAVKDPKGTVQRMPQTAAIVGGLAATLLGMIGLLLGLLAPKPATVKAKSKKVVDKTTVKIQEVKSEAEATASNVGGKKVDNTNNPEMFVKQRTTRSTTAAAAADAN